jgi:cell filamentation protein
MSEDSPQWQAYLWPSDDPGATMLRNKFGTHNRDELQDLEYTMTAMRQDEIENGLVDIERTGDAAEWRAIHRHLFQDVYDWAGELRTIDLNKTGEPFLAERHLDIYLHTALSEIRAVDWADLDRDTFIDAATAAYMKLNFAHPFREGNGRSSRVFFDRLTSDARFELDYSRIEPQRWNEANRATMNMQYRIPTDHSPLVPMFDAITIDREEADQDADPDTEDLELAAIARAQAALRAQAPRPAREALGRSRSATAQPPPSPPPMIPERDTGHEL